MSSYVAVTEATRTLGPDASFAQRIHYEIAEKLHNSTTNITCLYILAKLKPTQTG
jgi:hypothetical protein